MKQLIITFKDSVEVDRKEVEVPDPEPTELDKLQYKIAALTERIDNLEKSKIVSSK